MSIDYGLGRTNIDRKTGIRYGVISQHSVFQAWADSAEPDYGDPTCGRCGGTAVEYNDEKHEAYTHERGCADYACEKCGTTFDASDAFGDEPIGWHYEGDGYVLTDCLVSDIFVLKSPYYTYADFCSPCVPGAGNLESPNDQGAKSYCLGHDWFDAEKAPYPVYSVETDKLVEP